MQKFSLSKSEYMLAFSEFLSLLKGCLNPLLWLLFQPNTWHQYINKIDSSLSSDFCLVELQRDQWKNKQLRKLLMQICVVAPILILCLALVNGLLFRLSYLHIFLLVVKTITFSYAFLISFGSLLSIPMAIIASQLGAVFYSIGNALTGFQDGIYIYVIILAFLGGTIYSLESRPKKLSFRKNILNATVVVFYLTTAIAVATKVIDVLMTLVITVSFNIFTKIVPVDPSYTAADLIHSFMIDAFSLTILILISFSLVLKIKGCQSRQKLMIVFVLALIFGLSDFVQYPPELVYNFAMTTGFNWMKEAFDIFIYPIGLTFNLALIYGLTKRIYGYHVAAIAIMVHFVWTSAFDQGALDVNLILISCLVMYSGLTYSSWISILIYPISLIWNHLIYYFDLKVNTRSHSLLRFNSAFWDARQPLPLLGLDKHVVLVANRYPDEIKFMLHYLNNSNQQWVCEKTHPKINIEASALS